jgi:RNA polymerase sigma-70 factor (ECF subfamily)
VRHPHSDQIASPRSYFEADAENRAELTRLVIRAQADDLDAQSQLVRLYSHRIAGFLRTIVRDGNAIDDVTQMVFIKMVRRLNLLREAISFEAWLFAMARSTALDYLRSRRRRPELLADDPELFDTADTSSPLLMSEITEALTGALSQIAPSSQWWSRGIVIKRSRPKRA